MSYVTVFIITIVVVFIAFVGFEFWRHRKNKQRFESVRMIVAPDDVDGFISKLDDDIEKTDNLMHMSFSYCFFFFNKFYSFFVVDARKRAFYF